MKIGVISDTHGSIAAWNKAVSGPFADADLIIHAGDVFYHGPRNPLPAGYDAGALAEALNQSTTPVLLAKGNCDSEVDQMVLDRPMASPFLLTDQPIGRLLAVHGHQAEMADVDALAAAYTVDIWISGHTHIPLLERSGKTVLLNPGSPSLPKQPDAAPTVAIITADQIAIINLATDEITASLSR